MNRPHPGCRKPRSGAGAGRVPPIGNHLAAGRQALATHPLGAGNRPADRRVHPRLQAALSESVPPASDAGGSWFGSVSVRLDLHSGRAAESGGVVCVSAL